MARLLMNPAPLPENEKKRQLRVQQLCLTEDTPDEGFDRIVATAAEYFQAPIALISILDGQRQWFRARVGMSVMETSRDVSFCGYAILGTEVMVVPDAQADERFAGNPLVTGPPGIRFYAGMPLLTDDGLGLGSLCVIDTKPRGPLNARDLSMLEHFAGLVMARIMSLRTRQYVDEPTGLYNRLRLEQDVGIRLDQGEEFVVVAADMLSPRHINDIVVTLGFTFFNALMHEIKNRIEAVLPTGTLLYKISPTRFAFLLGGQRSIDQGTLYERILQDFAAPVMCEGIPVRTQVGIGALPLSAGTFGGKDWLRFVVIAANEARDKELGWTHFDPKTDNAQQRAFALLTGLSHAVDAQDQLWLEYQPVINLTTGKCTTVEALLRWRHPTLGMVGPGEFIPLAEKTALLGPLSRWVLKKSIEQTASWRRMGFDFKVAINVSAQDLYDPTYIDMMLALFVSQGVDPKSFKLEFTESALVGDPKGVAHQLERASAAGVTIAIDDFGTGYSNWIYLRQLPASVLKIDQAFIRNLANTEKDQLLVQSIIDMSQRMGFRIIAEGIETREALDLLRGWNCDEGQGYFIARPMPPDALIQWLAVYHGKAMIGEQPDTQL